MGLEPIVPITIGTMLNFDGDGDGVATCNHNLKGPNFDDGLNVGTCKHGLMSGCLMSTTFSTCITPRNTFHYRRKGHQEETNLCKDAT